MGAREEQWKAREVLRKYQTVSVSLQVTSQLHLYPLY